MDEALPPSASSICFLAPGQPPIINCELKNVPVWHAFVLHWDADGAMFSDLFLWVRSCVVATDQRSRLIGTCMRHLTGAVLALSVAVHTTEAADLPIDAAQNLATQTLTRPIELRVLKQDLPQVVQGLAEQAGVRVTLGKGLSKTVTNLHLSGSAAEALDKLSEHVGAVWWWSGSDVRMVDRTDLVTRTLKTRDIDQTLSAARSLGVPTDLLATAKADVPGIVRITGPSGLVAELETLAKDVAEQDSKVHVTRYGRRRISTIR
jgi:hypothetical protein